MINKEELINTLKQPSVSVTLLTGKHDPNNLSNTYPNYRSVFASELAKADDLVKFIASGDYTAKEYQNKEQPNSPVFIVIKPSPNSGFSVPASGVLPYSPSPSHPLDRVIIVSGTIQGWHAYGGDSEIIKADEQAGKLVYLRDLT
jgi:hypothetical protein